MIKKDLILIILFILSLLSIKSISQTTFLKYVASGSYASGNYVIQLYDSSFISFNKYGTYKMDKFGHQVWSETSIQGVNAGLEKENGDIIIISDEAKLIAKLNSLGNILWETPLAISYLRDIVETPDNGYLIACNGDNSFELIKVDSLGNQLWGKNYIGNEFVYGTQDIQENNEGNYIIVHKNFIGKINVSGNTIWTKTLDDFYYLGSVTCDNQNNSYITGVKDDTSKSLCLLKLNSNGDIIWEKLYELGRARTNLFYQRCPVDIIFDNGILVLTSEIGLYTNRNIYISKIDTSGNQIITKEYDYSYDDRAYKIQKTYDDGYIITGDHMPIDTVLVSASIFLFKVDSLLNRCDHEIIYTKDTICQGEEITFKTTFNDNVYWLKNNSSIGVYDTLYKSSSLINGDKIWAFNNECYANNKIIVSVHDTVPVISSTFLGYNTSGYINYNTSGYICEGQNRTIGVNPAYSYLWSTGNTTQSITINSSGEYSVTVNNYCGTKIDTINIIEVPIPYVFAGNDTFVCKGDTIQLHAIGKNYYKWSYSNSLIGTYISNPYVFPATNKTYTFYSADTITGCGAYDYINVKVNNKPIVNLGSDTTICLNDYMLLSINSNYIDVSWSNGIIDSSSILVNSIDYSMGNNTFYVVVTDTNFCIVSDTIIITIDNCLVINERVQSQIVVKIKNSFIKKNSECI